MANKQNPYDRNLAKNARSAPMSHSKMFGWREPYDDKEFLSLYDAGPLAVGRELLVPDI